MLRTFRYEKIADDLRQQINQGDFDRQKLPSERALMAKYGVQRSTVRQALSLLADEGRIITSDKRGSFLNTDFAETRHTPQAESGTSTVLVISPLDGLSNAMERLFWGLRPSLAGSRLSLLCFDSRPKHGKMRQELPDKDYLVSNAVKGIVLWPSHLTDFESLDRLRNFAPLVLVDRQISGFETHSVVFDDAAGARTVTEHLLALGHRHIGFLADEAFAETVQQRWRGYTEALESFGIAPEPSWYGLFQGIDAATYTEHIHLLMAGGGRPLSAVVCANDAVALRLMNHLRGAGCRVPEDVAVTGFGNFLPHSMEAVGLTTVSQPLEEAGQAVGGILARAIPGGVYESRGKCEHIKIPMELVIRASSGTQE